MWQSCFSQDRKGLYYIWKKETTKEKKAAQQAIDARNALHELEDKLKQEVKVMERRRGPSCKPTQKYTAERGAWVRTAKAGGIDQQRYREIILEKKLLPFANRCKLSRPNTIVQEDKAPSYSAHQQDELFSLQNIMRLLWLGNSPDLNMIEPTQGWMKRQTTRRGAISVCKLAEKAWVRY